MKRTVIMLPGMNSYVVNRGREDVRSTLERREDWEYVDFPITGGTFGNPAVTTISVRCDKVVALREYV